ncbi:glycoside hydrolase family 16 protein [Flavihumibacter sp. R14]|nr:glycoside hydrolase family 16 protein [Flavihumibacter soli]
MIKNIFTLVVTCSLLGVSFSEAQVKPTQEKTDRSAATASQPARQNWTFEKKPSWFDEFNDSGRPDSTKWGYDIGGDGWGNNELQYYTNSLSNSSVNKGVLTITARSEKREGKEYTSARLVSKNKGDFLYGRFEIKARLPVGKGTWPAIWMLPTDWSYGGWPASGEIDIMEHVGYDQDNVHMSVHTETYHHSIGTQKTATKIIPGVSKDFHVYRVDWTPDSITGFIDGKEMFHFVNEGTGFKAWPFDKRFHLLLNVAFGGNWGAAKGIDPQVLPQNMEVDYVRVYKMNEK